MQQLVKKISHFRLLVGGIILIFILIMTSFSFPDLFAMFYVPHFLFEGNIYTWVAQNKPVCPWLSATWPPLYYYTFGTYLWILETLRLFPTHLINLNSCPVFDLITDRTFLFWAKLPFLIAHIASAYIFSQFFIHRQKLWFLFWLLNPIAIFINFMEGQFDSIPTFFLLLGLYYAVKKPNIIYSALALGIGGAFKHYPFLLLIPFLLVITRNNKQRFAFLAAAILPYLLTIAFSFNSDFMQMLAFGENYKMFEAGIMIGNMKISYYVCLYALLTFMLLFEKHKNADTLIKYTFLFSVIYFITSFWFVQRLLFLLPPLLLLAATRKKVMQSLPLLSLAFFVYALIAFPGLFDHSLLRPILPAVQNIPYDILLPLTQMQTYLFSGFIALFLWLIYLAYHETKDTETIRVRDIVIQVVILALYCVILFSLTFIRI